MRWELKSRRPYDHSQKETEFGSNTKNKRINKTKEQVNRNTLRNISMRENHTKKTPKSKNQNSKNGQER